MYMRIELVKGYTTIKSDHEHWKSIDNVLDSFGHV